MPSRASARAATKKEPAAPKLGPTEPKTADDGPTVDSRVEVHFNDRKSKRLTWFTPSDGKFRKLPRDLVQAWSEASQARRKPTWL